MNILFLSPWFPFPADNGSKLRVKYLLRTLARQHTVTLVSFAFATADPAGATELQTTCAAVHTVKIDPFAYNENSNLLRFLAPTPQFARVIPEMQRVVEKVVSSQHFDVAVISGLVMSGYAATLPPDTYIVMEEHNSLSDWMAERHRSSTRPHSRARTWASWQKAKRFEAKTFANFDLVTMVSERDSAVTRRLSPHLENRVLTVPNGVDCQHNRPGLAKTKSTHLVYNGALTYYANFDAMRYFLADIYPQIRAQQPSTTLAITGSTKNVALTELSLDDSVTLTGFVEDIRLPVSEATVCVVPLRHGSGTRLKILEAMALGTPVVATSKGTEGLDLVPGEHLLVADTPKAFARATVDLIYDRGRREELAARARKHVERYYDWSRIAGAFVDQIESLADQKINHSAQGLPNRRSIPVEENSR